MARSPPPKTHSGVETHRRPKQSNVRNQQKRQRVPSRKHSLNLQSERLCRTSRNFRLGIRYAYRRRLLQPWKVKVIERERVVRVPDPRLTEHLEGLKRRNMTFTRENVRLKEEKFVLEEQLSTAFRTELDLYSVAADNEELKKSYSRLLLFLEENNGPLADRDEVEEFRTFLPNYKHIAQSKPGPIPYRLTVEASKYPLSAQRRRLHSPNPDLPVLKEEGYCRTTSRSWYGGSVAASSNSSGKRHCKRRTALPGEIERSISTSDRLKEVAPPSVDENQDDAQQTPNTDTAKAHAASSSSSGKDARNTPDTVDRLDLTAHQDSTLTSSGGTFVISKSKNPEPSTEPKSFQPEEMGKSPKKKRPFEMLLKAEGLAATRCSVGVRASPRLKAQARRSLQASFGNVLLEDSEKEEDLQDLTGRISLLEPSWSTTINQSINDLTSNEDDVPVPRNLFLDEDDGLTVATATRRPSRAAKAKIQTMKEPSLNSKMRRPANVEPLTSSQDKRHTARKSKKPSSTLTHKVIVHSSD